MHPSRFALLLFSSVALLAQGGGGVQFRDWNPPTPTAKPRMVCAELRSLTGLDLSVIQAAVIAATLAAPEHCRVSVLIQPEINVEVNLPTAWNARLYMFGNGGWAGESFEAAGRVNNRNRALKAGFVTAATDTGHSAAMEPGASFTVSRQKFVDFGFRSLHVTVQAARLLMKTYYGADPSKSYFDGCSTGGRQALMLAQRFPADFDGILAGAPGLAHTSGNLARAYWLKGLRENPFPAAKMGLLAERVYQQCDAKDGLKDGVIDDPRRCEFSAVRDLPKCAAGTDKADCFTEGQMKAVDRIHADIVRQGQRFFPGWPVGPEIAPPNGQNGWIGQQLDGPNGPGSWTIYGKGFLQFLAGPRVDDGDVIGAFDIDKDMPKLPFLHQVLDATDTDLSAFKKRGGKLLMYFGWADPQLNPRMGVEYYEQASAQMGESSTDFMRLFMVPGMFHCGGGVGTSTFDAMTPLTRWVEENQAPAVIQAARVVQGKTDRTRPLCAYPQVAKYKGSGSMDEAANFACGKP